MDYIWAVNSKKNLTSLYKQSTVKTKHHITMRRFTYIRSLGLAAAMLAGTGTLMAEPIICHHLSELHSNIPYINFEEVEPPVTVELQFEGTCTVLGIGTGSAVMVEDGTIVKFFFDEKTETPFTNGDIITGFVCDSPLLGVEGGGSDFTLHASSLQGNGEKSDLAPVLADPNKSLKEYWKQYVRFENMLIDDYEYYTNYFWLAGFDNLGNEALVSSSYADKGWPNTAVYSYVDCLIGSFDSRLPYTHMIIIDLGDETRVVHDFTELSDLCNEIVEETPETPEEWGAPRPFQMRGATTVIMHKGNDLWLTDGATIKMLNTDVTAKYPMSQGTEIASFSGQTPDFNLLGTPCYSTAEWATVTTSGKHNEVVPGECAEGTGFADYPGQFMRYRNVTVSRDTYQGMTIPTVTDQTGKTVFIPVCYDGIPEPGDYTYIDAIATTYASAVHLSQIVGFKVGEASGVGSINAAETEATVVGIYDLQGRLVNDTFHGVAIERLSDGTARRVLR